MTKAEAYEKVIKIITPFTKKMEALKTVGEETRIQEDLGVNSARLVDIILAFEDEFGIAVDDDSADRVRTVGDAVNMILEKAGA